jgi:hypothetical protein
LSYNLLSLLFFYYLLPCDEVILVSVLSYYLLSLLSYKLESLIFYYLLPCDEDILVPMLSYNLLSLLSYCVVLM